MLKFNDRLRALQKRRANGEKGFTLIELLVVMIIIGILAAIAIPIYLNQQKSARDSATTSDVRNLATNVQSLLVSNPDAASGGVAKKNTAAADIAADTTVVLTVDGRTVDVAKTKGTDFSITFGTGANAGTFVITGWNTNGKAYTTSGSGLEYNSAAGGLN